ncbi:hypothetical protein ACQX0C_11065 [Corynebacterium diphtheriae]
MTLPKSSPHTRRYFRERPACHQTRPVFSAHAEVFPAGNPNIRVMRVSDGSLMDSESQKILSDIATETGFQVWVELVDETGEHGIVIEDGQVRELIEEAV